MAWKGQFWRPFKLTVAFLVVWGAGCAPMTDILLIGYRNQEAINNYRYALGEQYIEIDGMTLCYQEFGPDQLPDQTASADPARSGHLRISPRDDSPSATLATNSTGHSRPVLLLLHGVGTSSDFWQLNIPAFARDYRVLALDLPGFGNSDKPDASYELTWLCEKILAFLDAKQVDQAHVLGASMGGHLSLMLAMDHPDRFQTLTMVGSCGAWEHPTPLLDWAFNTFWNEYIVTDHLRRTWANTFDRIFLYKNEITDRIFRYQMALRADATLFQKEGRASTRSLKSIFYSSRRDRLHDVQQPVLLIFGEGDFVHPPEDGVYLHQHIPRSILHIVEGANHEVMADRPDFFNETVLAFLRDHDANVH